MKFAELLKKVFVDEYWACGIRRLESEEAFLLTDDAAVHRYEPVYAGRQYWCADPFLVRHEGRTYLFLERMRKGCKKAVIGLAEIQEGRAGDVRPIIQAGHHLSYPAVFEHKGVFYMLPESRPQKTLTLWRALSFPDQWEQCALLLENREVADVTPYWDGKGWNLLIYEPDDASNRRTLYTAPLDPETGVLGPLEKRVAYKEKVGRPAGFPIRIGSRMILPTQIGVRQYGEAISYRELIINGSAFAERECARFTPDSVRMRGYRRILGIHTINRLDDLEVIDVCYQRFAPLRMFRRLLGRLGG